MPLLKPKISTIDKLGYTEINLTVVGIDNAYIAKMLRKAAVIIEDDDYKLMHNRTIRNWKEEVAKFFVDKHKPKF